MGCWALLFGGSANNPPVATISTPQKENTRLFMVVLPKQYSFISLYPPCPLSVFRFSFSYQDGRLRSLLHHVRRRRELLAHLLHLRLGRRVISWCKPSSDLFHPR